MNPIPKQGAGRRPQERLPQDDPGHYRRSPIGRRTGYRFPFHPLGGFDGIGIVSNCFLEQLIKSHCPQKMQVGQS